MDPFVSRILATAPLEAAEERRLASLARDGDAAARERLIESGLRAVALRARLLGFGGPDLLDAIQDGALGLIQAVDRFDPSRVVRLATYAWWWIGRAMARRPGPEVPVETLPDVPDDASMARDVALDVDVERLPEELSSVLRSRFRIGEDAGPLRPRSEVASLLGLSVAQVRDREAKAMRQLADGLATVEPRAPRSRGADPL